MNLIPTYVFSYFSSSLLPESPRIDGPGTFGLTKYLSQWRIVNCLEIDDMKEVYEKRGYAK